MHTYDAKLIDHQIEILPIPNESCFHARQSYPLYGKPSQGCFLPCFYPKWMIIHCSWSWSHPLNCVHAWVQLLFLLVSSKCIYYLRAATIQCAASIHTIPRMAWYPKNIVHINYVSCCVVNMDFLSAALHGNTPVKNAWRMKNKSKDKWYIIYAKTLEIKNEWMAAFHRERTRVLEDHDKGMLHNTLYV